MSESPTTSPTDLPKANEIDTLEPPALDHKGKRTLRRKVQKKAVEINATLRKNINKSAKELGVESEVLSQRFALIAPEGERRAPMWWNGLVAEYAVRWKDEYTGESKKGFLPWVSQRLKESGIAASLTEKEIATYTERAQSARIDNKAARTEGLGREKALELAQEKIDEMYTELQRLNRRLGIEFVLFTTRGQVTDSIEPMYFSSNKAAMFLEGHLNLPAKDVLALMDLSAVGGLGAVGLSNKVMGKKETHRCAVRNLMNTSFCKVAQSMGQDVTKFRHITYSNYGKLVYDHRIIARGYPLTNDGNLVRVSDLSGGIQGLIHAEAMLESGEWRFEQIDDSIYNDWKKRRDEALASNQEPPTTPYAKAPGTEFQKASVLATTKSGPNPRTMGGSKRKASSSKAGSKDKKRATSSGKASAKGKSSEFIEDSDKEDTPPLEESSADEGSTEESASGSDS